MVWLKRNIERRGGVYGRQLRNRNPNLGSAALWTERPSLFDFRSTLFARVIHY